MFGFLKKRLYRKMVGYVDVIKLAVYSKLWHELEEQYDQEKAKQLAAAVVNCLFGSNKSEIHANIPDTMIDKLANDYLQNEADKDVLNGIVMSLRTLMTIETDAHNIEATKRISDTVQWVKTKITLTPGEPNPSMMKYLGDILLSRYQIEDGGRWSIPNRKK